MVLVLSTVHVLACVLLIILVLLQQGKGADIGSTLGGDSSSLFGPMSENPLKNVTTVVAIIFMGTSLMQAYRARYDTGAEGKLFAKTPASVAAPLKTTSEVTPDNNAEADKVNTEAAKVAEASKPEEVAVEAPIKTDSTEASKSE